MLSLRQIEVLRAVMLTGSISGAARLLNVSAPGVSKMVKHAETIAGIRLFSRDSGAFVPTPEAAEIFEDLELVHARIEDINRRLAQVGRETQGEIRIGTSPGLGLSYVPQALVEMRRNFPTVKIAVDVLHVNEVVPYLTLRQVDLALTIYPVADPRVGVEKLAAGRLVCLVPEGHPLAAHETVSIEDIVPYPLIGFEPTVFQHDILRDLFARHGHAIEISISVRLMVTACALVKHGLGITLLDAFTVFGGAIEGTRAIPVRENFSFFLYAIRNPKAPLSIYAHSFLEILKQPRFTLQASSS